MRLAKYCAGALAIALFGIVADWALAADQWKFVVVNKSNIAAIEFRPQANGEWSLNQIAERIEPGDKFTTDVGASIGDCAVRTQIRFTDGTFFDADVDRCEARTLDMGNDKLTWE